MKPYKVSLLIPCTCKGRDEWLNVKDTYLYKLSLKTFLKTQNKEHKYVVYIGYDSDDRIFSSEVSQDEIHRFTIVFPNVSFKFIEYTNIKKGHLTKMWNVLYQTAYDDKCDYFYQCGDDITFKTDGWINDSILALYENNNVGISGPLNNNSSILTQAMFSRKHMEIFGWLFPEEILNWFCDDWYNYVYRPNLFYPLTSHYCSNGGGIPRYDINGNQNYIENGEKNSKELRSNTIALSKKHIMILSEYLRRTV